MHVALVGAEFEENLAVRYLWGALEAAGHRVTNVVFNEADEVERAAREVASSGADLAGLSMVFTYRAREFARVAARARELGYTGHIIAGGHFAAMNAEALLTDQPAFDSVALGEGEEILCDLASHLHDLGRVRGLLRRQGGELILNAPAVKPPDLDVLPVPPRKSPFDHYLGIPITNILASRGCSRSCAFCSIAAWHRLCGGERLRLRTPAALADEMAALYREGIRIFNFHDDNFVLDDKAAMVERMTALGVELERRGVMNNIAFAIKCRPDVVDAELFSLLKAMGMFRVFLGVEAGTAESLRRLGRGQTVSDNERALAILNGLDIHTCFNLLVLNPDSSLEDLAANVAFLRSHPHNAMNFCRTEIYAGTPLEKKLRKEGRLLGDYWGYDYVIADPRAQLAFSLIYPAFESRNYGDAGLHHLTMQIDYEQQLLRRFFGPHDALRRKVKRLVVDVNHNTCDHLDTVIEAVPKLVTEGDIDAFAHDLRVRVERDNARLGGQVQALLDELRRAPMRPAKRKGKRGWMHAAATAGLAATVIAAAGCREKSHPTEMAPAPTPTVSGPPPRDTGAESGLVEVPDDKPDAAEDTPPAGPSALVKPSVGEHMLKLLAEKITPAQPVELELWIGSDGKVRKAMVLSPDVSDEVEKALVERLMEMTFHQSNVYGQRFVVYFAKQELDKAGKGTVVVPPSTTHMKERVPPRPEMAPRPEMVPRPPPPRPEMAPRPPIK